MKGIWILGVVAMFLLAACVSEQKAVPFADEPGTNATIAPIGSTAANAGQPTQPAQAPAQNTANNATPAAAQPATNTTTTATTATTTAATTTTASTTTASTTPVNTTQTITTPTNTTSTTTTQTNASMTPSCLDTDGGDFKNVKGTVQLVAGNKQYLKTDFCVSTSLIEWYCDLSELKQTEYSCQNGCNDGACTQ
jgi:cytoskeletal protein RodZ